MRGTARRGRGREKDDVFAKCFRIGARSVASGTEGREDGLPNESRAAEARDENGGGDPKQ
jgi:hypothetical protein